MIEQVKNHTALNTLLYTEYNGKQMLKDVVVLRLTLIFLLVWTHVFAPFNGSWTPIEGVNLTYPKWIVQSISAARMPGLVFISGYLLGYTSLRKNNALSFSSMVLKKIRRLIVPCLFFSTIYYVLFFDLNADWKSILSTIVNGSGHLWFLPMLFWCFCGVWIVERFNIDYRLVFFIAICLSLLPGFNLPFRLSKSFQFFIFFYIGFAMQRSYIKIKQPQFALIPLLIIIYMGVFIWNYKYPVNSIVEPWVDNSMANEIGRGELLLIKILQYGFTNLVKLSLGITGVLIIYLVAHMIIIPKYSIPAILTMLSSYCYGVYIYHQFILRGLYYYTPLPQMIPETVIVWCVLPLTIILSLSFTHLTLKTKIGKNLIG